MNTRTHLSTLTAILLSSAASLNAAEWRLTVQAGEFDRRNTVIEFPAAEKLPNNVSLRDADGVSLPLQIDASGRAVFIEPVLPKGKSKTYTLTPTTKLAEGIKVEADGPVVKASFQPSGASIFHYQTEPGAVPAGVPEGYKHGAFLHPVFTPSGKIVTANHPPDHMHQRGIFFAWTKTEFEDRHPDFWNMGKGPDGRFTGEVRFSKLDRIWSGPVQGGFVSQHRFIDHTSGSEKEVLTETWEVTATHVPEGYLIDLISTQKTSGADPLKLPKYFYGGLGVRGAAAWDPVDQVTMLTSNGDDRKKGDNSKAKWVHMGGALDGQAAGIAVLIHSENFRFPQPLRLNPKNPQLCVAPSQDGDWEISPGKPYVSRYRLLIADGAADAAAIERQWNDYATPPTVEIRNE